VPHSRRVGELLEGFEAAGALPSPALDLVVLGLDSSRTCRPVSHTEIAVVKGRLVPVLEIHTRGTVVVHAAPGDDDGLLFISRFRLRPLWVRAKNDPVHLCIYLVDRE